MYIMGFPGQADRFMAAIEGLSLHDFPVDKIKLPSSMSSNELRSLVGNTQHCKAVGLAVLLAVSLVSWTRSSTKFLSSESGSMSAAAGFSYVEFHCKAGVLKETFSRKDRLPAKPKARAVPK